MSSHASVYWPGQIAAFCFPALGGLLFGYDTGATAFAVVQLSASEMAGVPWADHIGESSVLRGLVTASGIAGAFVAAMIATVIADWIGRRKEMLIAAFCFFIGSVLEVASGSFYRELQGIAMLSIGRGIYGVGCGFAVHAAPAYIAEMSPPHLRGKLLSLNEAAVVSGMVLGYSVGYTLSGVVAGWRFLYLVGVILPVVYGIGIWHLPYSARWLVLQDRCEEARESLNFFLNDGVEEVLCDICQQADVVKQRQERAKDLSVLQKLSASRIRRPLILSLGLVTLQQVSGQPSVLYYAEVVFRSAGIGSEATVVMAIFKFLMTMYSMANVETRGRKKNLVRGTVMMVVALFALSLTMSKGGAQVVAAPGLDFPKGVAIAAMLVYVGGYQVGFGPMVWLLVSEVFPVDVRGTAVGFAVQMNFFWNLLTTFTVPIMFDRFGESITFALFCIIALLSLWFIEEHVVETKGLSLEEIQDLFEKSSADKEGETPLLLAS
eukprot:gnl/MRDRNA2_/MRDRNA2_35024_c0_seq1.p1 gnl/MRDRNA2_/MRDRNA2_35024_c0~~gnl/MRDRNA2_/MRDRNA2_35024_c0_seq1.p1  ORF type:complete len:538 (+),score=87.23 gnl/MRDRNA2_/MRDRNA2_35024_c0_seq1:140-1615(+)